MDQKVFLLEFLTFQDVTGSLSRNVDSELPLYDASNPRRGQILCTDVNEWKTEIKQNTYWLVGRVAQSV